MDLEIDYNRAVEIGETVYSSYHSQEGLVGWKGLQGEVLPAGLEKGTDVHLLFLTMTLLTLDCRRDSWEQWMASKKTFEDPETNYIFNPRQLMDKNIKVVSKHLEKHDFSRRSLRDAKYLKQIAISCHRFFDSCLHSLLDECDYHGQKILNLLRSNRYRRGFPSLKSRKLAPLWLLTLYQQGGVPIEGLEEFPLGVDINIVRATLNSGAVSGSFEGKLHELKELVGELWSNVCNNSDYILLQLNEPLWHLGRYGCRCRDSNCCTKEEECPLEESCVSQVDISLNHETEVYISST